MLGEVIRQLDVRRAQVLVEAIIVEISDTAAKQLGVQLFLSGLRGSNIPFAVTNYSNISPNMNVVAGAVIANELRRDDDDNDADRSEEHTSELQSLMRISYAVFCVKKKNIYHIQVCTHTTATT